MKISNMLIKLGYFILNTDIISIFCKFVNIVFQNRSFYDGEKNK
nr:MAG TPA_asm: hypothetical protein [Caudoviricetes sp.]